MARLTNRQAAALFEYARKRGILEEMYQQALPLAAGSIPDDDSPISDELASFLDGVMENEIEPIMKNFVERAREELGILEVEVISAVELHDYQLARLEERLIRLSGKRVNFKLTIDTSIIGGLRILAGDVVIDNSIKTQINELKSQVYKGVYFEQ